MPKSQISLGMYDKSTNTTSSTNITNTTSPTPMLQIQRFRSHNITSPTSSTPLQIQQVQIPSQVRSRSQAGHCAAGKCSSGGSFDAAPD